MNYIRLVILILGMLFLSFLLLWWQYDIKFTYENISNVLFIIGIFLFMPAVIGVSQAYHVFDGIGYVFRSVINPQFRQEYPKFSDYRKERVKPVRTTVFYEILIASGILLVTSIILAGLAL